MAAKTGLAGFAVSWAGTGQPHQTASSSAFNRRLAMLVAAVHQVNRAGVTFSLWVAYISSARIRTRARSTTTCPTCRRPTATTRPSTTATGRPTLIMMGSRKYPQSVLDAFSARWRPHFYLVGDENWDTWNSAKAADFDADQYYWSSQNPVTNPASFSDIAQLAAEVRSTRNPDGSPSSSSAPWRPVTTRCSGADRVAYPATGARPCGAFHRQLGGQPDGWMVISWNEIDEGTYIMPLERYGTPEPEHADLDHQPDQGRESRVNRRAMVIVRWPR